jgi:hypothetical protein
MSIYVINFCPGDPCDPCKCRATFFQGQLDVQKKNAALSWPNTLGCQPPFFSTQVTTSSVPGGYGNYFSTEPQQSNYAAMLSSLKGNWTVTGLFDGKSIFTVKSSISYSQDSPGTWSVHQTDTISPPLQTLTFRDKTNNVFTESGWPYTAPIAPDNPPHNFTWNVAGTFQQIGGTSFQPAIITIDMTFRLAPGVYIFQSYLVRSALGHQLPLIRRFQTA